MSTALILDITPHNRPVFGFIAEAQGICTVLGMLVVQKYALSGFFSLFLNYLLGGCIGFCFLNWGILGFFRLASHDPTNIREFGRINLPFKPLFSINWVWDIFLLLGGILGGIGMKLIFSLVTSNSIFAFYSAFSIQGVLMTFIFFLVLLFGFFPESIMQIGTANQGISGFYWFFLWRKGLFIIVIGVLSLIIHVPQNILFFSIFYFTFLACIHYLCILLYLRFKFLLSFLLLPAILGSCSLLLI